MAKKENNLPTGITLRKDGRYMWRFKYENVQYSGYAQKLSDAKAQLRDKRYEVENGISGKESNIIFDAWFTEWIDVYKTSECKASTINFYRNTYSRYIKPVFGKKKVKDIKADQIQRFTNQKAKEFSKAIASTINFLLFDSLRQAVRSGIISKNPMEKTTTPRFKEVNKGNALTSIQENIFLDAVKDSSYYPLYRTASLSGMRIGEVLGLMWEDVDFQQEEIRVNHILCYNSDKGQYIDTPKTKASRRTIPMIKGGELYNLMKKRRIDQFQQRQDAGKYWTPKKEMENLVFTTEVGTPHYDTNIRTHQRLTIKNLQEQGIEIPSCTFHTLRHCFATRCIENGMNPKTLQAILGHSTFSMTMDLYCDVMKETMREEMHRIQAVL